MYIGFCHNTCSHQTTEGTNTFSKSLCKETFRVWLQKYWHEQIALKASFFILWKDVLTGSTDKLLAHYSPSNTLKTTMLKKKRKPDANSSQNHFLIGLNPYIFMKLKYFWNTYTKSVWNETVEACEPLCYIIKMLHVLNTKGWNKDRDIFEDISDLSGP